MPDNKEMENRYRNVFGTPEGRAVLGDILTLGHFGVTLDAENREQVSEYNLALVIATKAGAMELVLKHLGMVKEKSHGSSDSAVL